jgi:hypothetical protein
MARDEEEIQHDNQGGVTARASIGMASTVDSSNHGTWPWPL